MNDPCGVVLYSLQLADGAGWSAVQHSVAVVDAGNDQTTLSVSCLVRLTYRAANKKVTKVSKFV